MKKPGSIPVLWILLFAFGCGSSKKKPVKIPTHPQQPQYSVVLDPVTRLNHCTDTSLNFHLAYPDTMVLEPRDGSHMQAVLLLILHKNYHSHDDRSNLTFGISFSTSPVLSTEFSIFVEQLQQESGNTNILDSAKTTINGLDCRTFTCMTIQGDMSLKMKFYLFTEYPYTYCFNMTGGEENFENDLAEFESVIKSFHTLLDQEQMHALLDEEEQGSAPDSIQLAAHLVDSLARGTTKQNDQMVKRSKPKAQTIK